MKHRIEQGSFDNSPFKSAYMLFKLTRISVALLQSRQKANKLKSRENVIISLRVSTAVNYNGC